MNKINIEYLPLFLSILYVTYFSYLFCPVTINRSSIKQEVIILEDVRLNNIPAMLKKSDLLNLLGNPDRKIISNESFVQYKDELELVYWFYDEPMISFFIIEETAYVNQFILSSNDYIAYDGINFDLNTEYYNFENMFPTAYRERLIDTENEVFAIYVSSNYSNTSVIRFNFENNKLKSVDHYP